MELYKKQLLDILNSAINGKKFNNKSEEIFEWEKIIKEADKHEISALIYYSIDKEILKKNDKDILNKWKVHILESNISQIHILNFAREIFLELQKKEIRVIALKGIILKNFYPIPEFRTMGDLDILINIKDYNFVEEYLIAIGYTCSKEKSNIHAVFYSENGPDIEVHWKLVNDDYYSGDVKEFEKSVWKNAKEENILDLKLLRLSDEDFLIHLCMHMAVHAKCAGFGLRQVYDLALFTKNKYKKIDWMNFKKRISKYGILTFVEGLYILCDKLFQIKVPYFDLKNISLKEEDINLLLENIIYFGVNLNISERADYNTVNNNYSLFSKVKRIMQIVFENKNELSQTYSYSYVKKHAYLIPIAWIHRIFRVVKKYGLINIYKYMKQSIEVREKKNQIVDIFNL